MPIYIKDKKQLPRKNTQKVNKQKIRCKNWGFVLVVWMSWLSEKNCRFVFGKFVDSYLENS